MMKILNVIKNHMLVIITLSLLLASLAVMFVYYIYNSTCENYVINYITEESS